MSDSAAGSEYNGDDFYCDVAIPHVAALQVEHNDEWVWFASELAIEIGVWIRQHLAGSPTHEGGSDHVG